MQYDDFLARFVHGDRPVVITNICQAWPAMREWTPEKLARRLGSKSVPIGYGREMPFDRFIAEVLASSAEQPGPYMYRSFLHDVLPELLPDVMPPHDFAFPRRYASPLMPEKWRRPDGYLKLLIGGVGSKFPVMHFDADNQHAQITQVYGDKEFVVFSPADSPCMYPRAAFPNQSMVDDPVQQDRARFPLLAQATLYRTVLKPGEMVFVPARWWHAARALSTSISLCTNMLDESNWQGFHDEVVAGVAKTSPEDASRLGRQLQRVDGWLTRLERFQRRRPGLARALLFPAMLAPLTAGSAPDPSRRQLRIRVPSA
ncbi:cupin-like domain-containing protein [Variovorax saccharolyticus]|uniref:cupin-like domain-containing protein n=1 Tax=Variovorax saccharolyticus TaxID=3053516 RepID=UPI00257568C9|nr:cupin-like domain-containing protein [Variovorax sp. J31P216]MDM0024775.1 cupin-like domain-containing protein [Variovorax sp. J31P216]